MRCSPFRRGRVLAAAFPLLAFAVIVFAVTLTTRSARAQEPRTPLGDKGTLVLDQLSGFRASTVGGVGYAGPIGFSTQTLSANLNGPTGATTGTESVTYTSFWFAPSADYFVIDHLSIGGIVEIASTSQSATVTANGPPQTTLSTNLPTITSITVLPRVGWMFALSDHWGIWPRAGIGYASRSMGSLNPIEGPTTSDTFSGFVFDLDVGILYRVNENWFLKLAPELTFAPGSVSHQDGNVTTSTGGTLFQFAGVGGIGVMWDLL